MAWLAVDIVHILSCTDRPDFWDSNYDELVSQSKGVEIYKTTSDPGDILKSNVALKDALDLWVSGRFCVISMGLPYGDTAKRISREIEEGIPAIVRETHVSWDVHITLGPWSEPDWEQTKTVASGTFRISFSGDNCPCNPGEYLRLFKGLKIIQELMVWLKDRTSCDWDINMSLS